MPSLGRRNEWSVIRTKACFDQFRPLSGWYCFKLMCSGIYIVTVMSSSKHEHYLKHTQSYSRLFSLSYASIDTEWTGHEIRESYARIRASSSLVLMSVVEVVRCGRLAKGQG